MRGIYGVIVSIEFNVMKDLTSIAEYANRVRLWIANPAELLLWTGTEFAWGQTIEQFDERSQPLEAITLTVEGELVGYCELHHNLYGWVLARCLIHPKHRGQGLGQKLLLQGLQRAHAHGPQVHLFVHGDNLPALALYRKVGFELVGQVPEEALLFMRHSQVAVEGVLQTASIASE